MPTITRTEIRRCPSCDGIVDAHTPSDPKDSDAVPGPGDLSICFECGEVLAFNDDMSLRLGTEEERFAIDPKLIQAIKMGRKMVNAHKAKKEIERRIGAPLVEPKEVFPVDPNNMNSMVEAIKSVVTIMSQKADLGPLDSLQILLSAAVLLHHEYCPVRDTRDTRKVFQNVVDAVWKEISDNYQFFEAKPEETLQ